MVPVCMHIIISVHAEWCACMPLLSAVFSYTVSIMSNNLIEMDAAVSEWETHAWYTSSILGYVAQSCKDISVSKDS